MPYISHSSRRRLSVLWGSLILVGPLMPSTGLADEGKRRTPQQVAADIDRCIDVALTKAKVAASPPADDGEFLRRASLDLIGRIPTGERAGAFLDDADPDKNRKLIDELLASPEYGRHFGTLWHNRIVPLNAENQREMKKPLFLWLAEGFNQNRPWSQTVSALLLADGDIATTPTVGFYLSWNNTVEGFVHVDRVTGSVADLFMGVNLRCAQCHDHPFAKWKQSDFWGTAAFFGRVGYTKDVIYKRLVESPAIVNREGKPSARPDASIVIPDKNRVIKARFLEEGPANMAADVSFRRAFVDWLTSAKNQRFARAAVNRFWAQFFGRGLVNPTNDLHDDNPPSHPELLDLLAKEFIASGHDQKHLLRCICATRAYQRTSRPLPGNKDDDKLFSHVALKQISAEALFDSVLQVLDGLRYDQNLVKSVTNPGRDHWIVLFSTIAPDAAPTNYTHGVRQVLPLLNSSVTNSHELPLIRRLLKEKVPRSKAMEQIFLAALSRRPTADEAKQFADYLDGIKDPTSGYRDVWWVLLNSSEFLFNH